MHWSIGLLLACLTLPSPTQGQEPLLIGLARAEDRQVVAALQYDGREWTRLQAERFSPEDTRDSPTATSARLPQRWFLSGPGRRSIEVPVGPVDESYEQRIETWPERLHLVEGLGAVFSQAEVIGYPFDDIRGNVIKWSRALELLEPALDSAEAAWVDRLPEGIRPRIPGQLGARQAQPIVFTTLLQAGRYIWFEAERAYPRSPDHPDPRCWDVSVLEGWLHEEPPSPEDPSRVEGPAGFRAERMNASFRVTDCDDKGHGYFRAYSMFSYDDREWVLALRAEYDAMHEGLETEILQRIGQELSESSGPSPEW